MSMRALLAALALAALAAPAAATAAPPASPWYSFAPYVDLSAWPPPELSAIRNQGGVESVSLGFVVNRTGATTCAPRWGGYDAYAATGPGAYRLADVQAHQAAGGHVVVSFGGQAGKELALACTEAELTTAYRDVIDAYGVSHIDLDIEGAAVHDVAANAKRAKVLAALQAEFKAQNRPLYVSYTVAVLPRGLLEEDLALLQNAVDNGVRLDLVNLMAMNYGAAEAPNPGGRLDEYAAQAALSARNQLRQVFPGDSDAELMRRIGLTPMIGINDVASEQFSVQEAHDLTAWANDAEVGMLGMWALGRDKPCEGPTTQTSPDCSGVAQRPWDFAKAFGAFDNTPGTPVAQTARSDFNGDGYGDLAIGAPGETNARGAVHVVYGDSTGLDPEHSQLWTQASPGVLDAPENDDRFGEALATGDFNGDGAADLAIGVPGENSSAGAVAVLYGSPVGITDIDNQLWSQNSPGVDDGAGALDRFGAALARREAGDSARADLAIGAPDEDLGSVQDAGVVHVLRGGPTGLTATGSRYWSQNTAGILDTAEAGDHFGAALAGGEAGGGWRGDLAIGAPGENAGAGAVHLAFGLPSGLSAAGSRFWTQNAPGVLDTAESGDGFGAALAMANMGGTPEAELAVGAPGEDLGAAADGGAVHVLRGHPNGMTAAYSTLWSQSSTGIADAPESGDRFGAALATGELGITASGDLAIGIPGENSEAGAVAVIYGSTGGLASGGSDLWSQAPADVADAPEAGDRFGHSLTTADFGNSARGDLAIAVPEEGIGTATGAGAVHVLPGSGTGLTTTGSRFLNQGTTGIADAPEVFDGFGWGLGG